MGNKYFLHEIRIGKTTSFKGIVFANTFDDAKQGYHAFLGAYAYGHDTDTYFVQAMITDMDGATQEAETWLDENLGGEQDDQD